MSKYFKKPNGAIVEYDERIHDIKSLEDRFEVFLKLQEQVIKTQDFSINRLLNIDDLLKN